MMKSFLTAGVLLLCGVAQAAQPCEDALARFDYLTAIEEASVLLQTSPNDAVSWICLARARYERGDFRTALEALNEAAKQPVSGPLAVKLGNWFGVTLRRLGRNDEAWHYQQAALVLAKQVNDQAGLATALHNTAGMRYDRGDIPGALRDYQTSIPINPDLSERSASYNNVGLIYQWRGDYLLARQALEAAIALNRQGNHFHHLGKHLMNLGNLERQLGRYDEARSLLNEGRTWVEKAGDVFWLGIAAHYQAWLARDQRQIEAARKYFEEAKRYYEQAGAADDLRRLEEQIRLLN